MASYDAPNPYVPNTFNSSNFILPGTTITTKYLNENYLQFPFAQGTENFVSINNQGSLTQGGRAEFSSTTNPVIFTEPPTITNPVIYPATIPGDSLATITYVNDAVGGGGGKGGDVYTNLSNIYETGLTQTFQGNSTFPTIVITNTINNSTASLSTTTNNSLEITSTQGVALSNGNGNTVSFAAIDGNIFHFNNPIRIGYYLQTPSIVFLSSGTTYGTLTGNNGGITSDVNFTALSITATTTINTDTITANNGVYTDQVAIGNNGVAGPNLIINGNGTQIQMPAILTGDITAKTLTIESSSGSGILSVNNQGIGSTVDITIPAQTTYDSGTTYGNLASTQQFVQKAIESQGGGGDAYLGNIQTFTAQNTFTGGCNITNNATCGTTTVDIVNNPYGIVNNTMLTNYSPYQYSYISGTCSPNYDIVLGTNPYIVASYQSTIQNFTNAASSATYNFICSRVNNVGTLTFNFIPSIPTSGNQQTINNMICITRTVPNNTFWPAGKPPSSFFNLTDMIVLAYFQVPVAYFNANAYNYVNQLFLQYDTGSGIEGQMVGVCIIPIIVVDVYYYIMAIIPNGAIHYTLPSIYSIYIPQISISIPLF